MGGRGTGKTTLLNFMKVTLKPHDEEDRHLTNLLRSNLGAGTITLEIQSEDKQVYNIVKTLEDPAVAYTVPLLDYIPLSSIIKDIECDFYDAGRIEEIGRNSKDRLLLIDKKIAAEVEYFKSHIFDIQSGLAANALEIKSYHRRMAQFDDVLNQYANVNEEFEIHKRQKPVEIGEEANSDFEEADRKEGLRRQELRFFNKSVDFLHKIKSDLVATANPFRDFLNSEILSEESYQNKAEMLISQEFLHETIEEVRKRLGATHSYIESRQKQLDTLFSAILNIHSEQQSNFVRLKQQFDQSREYINKYNLLSKRITESTMLARDRDDLTKKYEILLMERSVLLEKLNGYKNSIFRIRLETVKGLNSIFNKEVVITLSPCGIKDDFYALLRQAFKGSGIQYNALVNKIAERFTPDQFAKIVHERNVAALTVLKEIDTARAKTIISSLYETDYIYEIESLYCDDMPEFKLRIADDSGTLEENYRRTDELSMGQRCTTVLPIIFAVSSNPLIIDQPEDNLDNKYITQSIHETIRAQKVNRQLIFITHNPNIPVLSDADHNVFLEYENRKSKILHQGTIEEVKDDIIFLLEGGAAAFERRMQIYGYNDNQAK